MHDENRLLNPTTQELAMPQTPVGSFPTERRVRVEPIPSARRAAFLAELANLPGMAAVDLTGDGQALFLRYDPARLTFEQVEQVLAAHEVRLPQDWKSRLHAAWCEFSDRNVYDSAHTEPGCCGNPPRRG